jgi:ADP-ribose pyrophosphatase YjhB (NUDIX family)
MALPSKPTPASQSRLPKLTREISVMAWIEDACGQVLMVQQTARKGLWALPGGKTKSGETLEAALRRELLEEIGEQVRSAHLAAIFDRPEKRNLTVLFRVRLVSQRLRAKNPAEIVDIAFKSRLPKNASLSAAYFWKQREHLASL